MTLTWWAAGTPREHVCRVQSMDESSTYLELLVRRCERIRSRWLMPGHSYLSAALYKTIELQGFI